MYLYNMRSEMHRFVASSEGEPVFRSLMSSFKVIRCLMFIVDRLLQRSMFGDGRHSHNIRPCSPK